MEELTKYRYRAMDRAGRDIKGTIDAINEEEVVEKVRSMGYFPTEIVLKDELFVLEKIKR